MRRALLEVPGIELAVIAPDSNRSASARSITTRSRCGSRRSSSRTAARASRPTARRSTACASRALGLIEFEPPELIVSGINHGANLGDDITYSGTVAAALEGVVLGLPAIAVSQQSKKREMDFRLGREFDFEPRPRRSPRAWSQRLAGAPDLARGTLLNVNCPAVSPEELAGAEVTRLGKRIYRDKLELQEEDATAAAAGATGSTATTPPTTTRTAPTSPRSTRTRSRSRRCTST